MAYLLHLAERESQSNLSEVCLGRTARFDSKVSSPVGEAKKRVTCTSTDKPSEFSHAPAGTIWQIEAILASVRRLIDLSGMERHLPAMRYAFALVGLAAPPTINLKEAVST